MSRDWRKGDRVRNKFDGKEVEVFAYKPRRRTLGIRSCFIKHETGFTFLNEQGREVWEKIEDYELIEKGVDNMASLDVKVLDMNDGEVKRISYEGEEYARVDEARVGDVVKVVKSWGGIPEGNYYKVMRISRSLGDTFVYINETTANGREHYFEIFRKVSAPTHEERIAGLETRVDALEQLSETKPVKGDKIRITRPIHSNGEYKAGDVLTVKEYVKGYYGDDFVIAEGIKEVVVESEFEILDEEEAKQYELCVGDYVEITGKTYEQNHGFVDEVPKYAEIIGDKDYEGDFEIRYISDGKTDFAQESSLKKVEPTDEELKFYKMGREPNEYKVGDIVRITANTNESANKVGDIGIITDMSNGRLNPIVHVNGRYGGRYRSHTKKDEMELIAPVENRVDDRE